MPSADVDTDVIAANLRSLLNRPEMTQQAVDAVNEFTRTRVREDGFYRSIIPQVAPPTVEAPETRITSHLVHGLSGEAELTPEKLCGERIKSNDNRRPRRVRLRD